MPYELNSYDEQIFLDVLFRMPLSSKLVTEDKVESDDADSYLEPFPSSFRRLFPLEKGNFVSRGYLDSNKEWADFANEKKGWEVYQECLDTFVQRLSVNTDSKEKQILRKWYEFLLEIGDYYFNRN